LPAEFRSGVVFGADRGGHHLVVEGQDVDHSGNVGVQPDELQHDQDFVAIEPIEVVDQNDDCPLRATHDLERALALICEGIFGHFRPDLLGKLGRARSHDRDQPENAAVLFQNLPGILRPAGERLLETRRKARKECSQQVFLPSEEPGIELEHHDFIGMVRRQFMLQVVQDGAFSVAPSRENPEHGGAVSCVESDDRLGETLTEWIAVENVVLRIRPRIVEAVVNGHAALPAIGGKRVQGD
jgi:hypothetical protein